MHAQSEFTMWFTVALAIIFIGLCVVMLGVKIFFTKDGKFPDTHVGGNIFLRKKGISCMKSQDLEERNKKNIFELSNPEKKTTN